MQPDYNPPPPGAMRPQFPPQIPIPVAGGQPPMMVAPPPKRPKTFIWIMAGALFVLLFILTLVFALWAFAQRNSYKNDFEARVDDAVSSAVAAAEAEKEADFAEREKDPLTEYVGPAAFGSIEIRYPRTWSAFVTENQGGSVPVDGYFHPGHIPGIKSGTAFALHLEVLESDYANELRNYDGDTKAGKIQVTPIQSQDVTGARIDGQITNDKKGSIVLFPLRDKTLKLTTESEEFMTDFNDTILANLSFSP